jgi:hypothetical protein
MIAPSISAGCKSYSVVEMTQLNVAMLLLL